jgi:cytochrome P450 family 103
MEAALQSPIIEFSDAELDASPHQCVATIRQHGEVWRRTVIAADREVEVYTIFSHDLCAALLNHEHVRQFYTPLLLRRGVTSGPLLSLFTNGMQTVDHDVHRRRRKPLSGLFTMAMIKGAQPNIKALVRDHIGELLPQKGMSLWNDLAKTLPPKLICRMIGIPGDDIDRMTVLAGRAFAGLTAFNPEQLPDIEEASQELHDYVHWLIDEKGTDGRNGFLKHYLDLSEAATSELSEAEIQVQLIGLILASAQTTGMAIMNAISLLLSHPAQWAALKADPAMLEPAVNETLRFEPSIATCSRYAVDDIRLGGITIPANAIISVSLLGALRDPMLFAEPQQFNIMRTDFQRKHMVFGVGAHRCLGESLASIELYETISAIAEMMPDIRLIGDPVSCTGFTGIRKVTDCNVVY